MPSPPVEPPPPGVPPAEPLAFCAFKFELGDAVDEVAEKGRLNAPDVDDKPNGV